MKWLVVLCLLASPAAAATTWTITTRTGQAVTLDVTRTPTGYTARFHERQTFWESAWQGYGCPNSGDEVQAAGEVLLQLDRQRDGTFSVKMYKARMYNIGPDGPGSLEVGTCVFDSPYTFTGTIVNRSGAAALDHAQVDRYPADHDSFLALHYTSPPCPVPDTAKRTCAGGQWPFHPIIDMPLPDSDGDGISDEWEISGIRDGASVLDLKAMGADPDHKDLFIQMDTTSETTYPPDVLNEAARILSSVPITNPDGHNGIHLHLDAGSSSIMNPVSLATWGTVSRAETSLSVADHLTTWTSGAACGGPEPPVETPISDLYNRRVEALRKKAFRYIAVVKYLGPSTDCYSGMNWTIVSKYFVIAAWGPHGKLADHALLGTLLHELGHSIGLRHGGGHDEPNYNPVYQSVMNYAYQIAGVWSRGQDAPPGEYRYSNSASASLDETHLAERTGFPNVGLPGTMFNYKCSVGLKNATPNLPTDLDCDTHATTPAPIDITPTNRTGPTTLFSFNDVAAMHLPLDAGTTGVGAGAVGGETQTIGEALHDLATLAKDTQDPTVKLTLSKKQDKRFVTIKAHDDRGLATAMVTSAGKTQVISLSKLKKLVRDATQKVEVDPAGEVTVVVVDIVDKSATATAK